MLCGVYVVHDALRQGRRAAGLAEFARVNGLVHLRAAMAPHYVGSLFAQEVAGVSEAVRSADPYFVEIGDRWLLTTPQPRELRLPEVYLRLRMTGPPDLRAGLPPALDQRIRRFAGQYAIECSRGELTLFGAEPLGHDKPGRVREAFLIADQLAQLATPQEVPFTHVELTPTPPGNGRRFGPLRL